MVHKSSRLFNQQCLVPLCVGVPVAVGGLLVGPPFCLLAVICLSPLWMPVHLSQNFVNRASLLLLGSLWVGTPSECPAVVAAILGREVPQLWAGAHHWVVWAGTLWAGTSRCLLSWADIWLRKVEKMDTAEPDMQDRGAGRCAEQCLRAELPSRRMELLQTPQVPNLFGLRDVWGSVIHLPFLLLRELH